LNYTHFGVLIWLMALVASLVFKHNKKKKNSKNY